MAFTAVGGLCVGIEYGFLYPDMGPLFAIYLYAAIVVGGLGNPYGALLGSLIIGLSMEVSTLFIPPQYKVAVAFVILMVFLFVRPQGIIGVKRRY
jgi:branched-subunit amino acid ABC-type transport system permease component